MKKVSFFDAVCCKEFGYSPRDVAKADGLVFNVAEEGDYIIQPMECKTRVSRNLVDDSTGWFYGFWNSQGCKTIQQASAATQIGLNCDVFVEATKKYFFKDTSNRGSVGFCSYKADNTFYLRKWPSANGYVIEDGVTYLHLHTGSGYGMGIEYEGTIIVNEFDQSFNGKYEPYGNLVDILIDNTWTPVAIEKGKTIHLTAGTHTFRLDTSLGTSAQGLIVRKLPQI